MPSAETVALRSWYFEMSYTVFMRPLRGFTLTELLIVIAIIGILSAVTLGSLSTARTKAQYARVVSDLRQIEKAMNLVYDQYGCWPRESATVCVMPGFVGETQLKVLVAQPTGLGAYLKGAPSFPFPHAGSDYILDNDGDVHNPATCVTDTTQAYRGVVINIRHGSYDLSTVFENLNRIIDGDADSTTATAQGCGKMRYSSGDLFYSLSDTQ
jgi:prepilin-type N-terminal cleavage/methylation domain-containing protein